jgi:hypothetical protein
LFSYFKLGQKMAQGIVRKKRIEEENQKESVL